MDLVRARRGWRAHQFPNIIANDEMRKGSTSIQRVATGLAVHRQYRTPKYADSAARQPAAILQHSIRRG